MELLKREITSFQAIDIEADTVDTFNFEGFDATHILELLKRKEQNGQTFIREMNILCVVGLKRGTRIDKIADTMSTRGKTELIRLKNKYGIREKVMGASKRDVITLGRIMATFPNVCLHHVSAGHVRDYGVRGEFALAAPFRFTQFAALIPTDNEALFNDYLVWATAVDNVINVGKGDATKVRNYATIQRNNSIFSNDQRNALLAQHE
jgi:hypothetical protein